MINKRIKKLIEKNILALASCSNNKPHVIAVGDVKVVSDRQILIGDNYMKITIDNIKKNNKVSLVGWNDEEGASLDGTAKYFKEGKWLEQVKKIHKGHPAKGAILVTINKIKVLS